jgi:hypothetical protein
MLTPEELLRRQNPGGGWGYHPGQPGGSWTEPTCYALLALAACGAANSADFGLGMRWLAERQGSDGGCVPNPLVHESTWVTALALLVPPSLSPGFDRDRAALWLVRQTGRESGFVHRLRMRLLGVRVDESVTFDGWPWYPGAGAWVTPTALSILALEKREREKPDGSTRRRIVEGRDFLLARRCHDGGWNHGSTKALGYDSDSYPEMTGAALLALHGANSPSLAGAIELAERHLAGCQSNEAASWLTLALLAHRRSPRAVEVAARGGNIELALALLARAAQTGPNLFVDSI